MTKLKLIIAKLSTHKATNHKTPSTVYCDLMVSHLQLSLSELMTQKSICHRKLSNNKLYLIKV